MARKKVDEVKPKKKGTLAISSTGKQYINTGGAPSFPWTDELEDEITEFIATNPLSVKQACLNNLHWPNMNLVFERIHKSKRFGELYLQAKQRQVHCYNEQSFDILEAHYDNPIDAAMAKERVSLRKWQASRLMPRLYGDRTEQIVITNEAVLSKENQELKEQIAKYQVQCERDY